MVSVRKDELCFSANRISGTDTESCVSKKPYVEPCVEVVDLFSRAGVALIEESSYIDYGEWW